VVFSIPLNKFEKEKRVIALHLEGKTIRDIAKEVKMSFRDISKIIKAYDKKVRLKSKRETQEGNTQMPKKLSLSTQAFILYQEGKKIDETKVLLDIPFKLAIRYWKQYLKSIGMFEAFEFYQDHSNDIPTLLSINTFMKRNNISGNDVVNVLREANDVINLNQIISNLKSEWETWQGVKYNYYNAPLEPLPKKINWNYPKYQI
jgi:transposase